MKVILNAGLGVDSTAIILKVIRDPAARRALGIAEDFSNLIVITAMTGNEWPDTGRLNEEHMLPLLRRHGIRYVQVARNPKGAGSLFTVLSDTRAPKKLHIEGNYKLSDELHQAGTIPTSGGTRKCSIKFKGEVIDAWLAKELDGAPFLQVMGFHADEGKRAKKDREAKNAFGPQRTPSFPLIDWGWDRQRCEDYIEDAVGEPWKKSACSFCPFAKDHLVPRLREFPAEGVDALMIEHKALALNPRMMLFARRSLREVIATAGLDEILERFKVKLSHARHAIFRVRRVFRSKTNAVRKIEKISQGTRAAMERQLGMIARELGREIETDAFGIARINVQGKGADFPCREEMYSVSPAAIDEKTGPGFDKSWTNTQPVTSRRKETFMGKGKSGKGRATPRRSRPRIGTGELIKRSKDAAATATKEKRMSGLDAAAKVMAEAAEPLQCKVIVDRALEKGYWKTEGKTPAATMYSAILREIQKKGDQARFQKAERGKFTLRISQQKKGA